MKLVEYNLTNFIALLASKTPAPGGGSAAALIGALGAALTAMVCALTEGKRHYAEHQPLIMETLPAIHQLQRDFLAVIDRDTLSFNRVSHAFTLPKESETDKQQRHQAIQQALQGCTLPPYEMMNYAHDALRLTQQIVGKSNQNAASDLGVAALALKTALQGAWLNVLINLNGIEDKQFVQQYRQRAQHLLNQALPLADEIYQHIAQGLEA